MLLFNNLRLYLIFIFAATISSGFSQNDSTHMVRYTPEFKFKEGIFINFDQVKQNNPIPKSRLVTSVAYDNPDFFELILKEKKIYVFDNLGSKQEIPVKNIWGFSRNGVLYISLNEGYYRITMIGSICHFVANLTTYNNNYANPYYNYYYPYYSYPYSYPYYSPYSGTRNTEMRQYLLDFNTGNVLDYNEESVELLLMADPELHDEFAELGKRKRKQMKFLYIRKFNERNPVYFSQN
jgi:hypothetical protein